MAIAVPKVARKGDNVRYQCQIGNDIHSGTGSISGGSPDVKAEGQNVARDGDPVNCGPCGTGTIRATGTTKVNGRKIALVGDSVNLPTGSGTITSGAKKVSST